MEKNKHMLRIVSVWMKGTSSGKTDLFGGNLPWFPVNRCLKKSVGFGVYTVFNSLETSNFSI